MDSPALRDIHLPQAVSWWPPAPGWWLVVVLLPLLILLLRMLYRRLKQKSAVKQARILLNQIRAQRSDTQQTLTNLSALLRRVALSYAERETVAGLSGKDWLRYLDRNLPDAPFSEGLGRCLADAHYRPSPTADIDIEAVFALCERWLRQQGKNS